MNGREKLKSIYQGLHITQLRQHALGPADGFKSPTAAVLHNPRVAHQSLSEK